MTGHHARRAAPEGGRGVRRTVLAVVVPLALVTLAAMVWWWPSEGIADPGQGAAPQVEGVVSAIMAESCPEGDSGGGAGDVNGCGTTRVLLTSGKDAGEEITTPLPSGPGAPEIDVDDRVVLIRTDTPDGELYSVVDHQRSTGLWVLAGAFVLALVAFGRWRGVTALLGLAVTFAILVLFVVPAILAGEPPLLVAIVGSAAIILTVLYLTHGFGLSTSVAILGTLASLALTGVLAAVSVSALNLTGITDDISTSLGTTYTVNMQGLLLAGIVIGSLGVLDDVTITQAATVTEVARANPSYGFGQLYRAGTRVGRSHIASVVNTIVLAYAGSSLPLVILIVAYQDSLGSVLTTQTVAQEIVRSVVGTLGLVAAVPITTALAAVTARLRW